LAAVRQRKRIRGSGMGRWILHTDLVVPAN
jgi:hypothetical protein